MNCLALESRILYSAAPLEAPHDLANPSIDPVLGLLATAVSAGPHSDAFSIGATPSDALHAGLNLAAATTLPTNELVFVNSDVADYGQLIQSLSGNASRSIDVVVLDTTHDGINDITAALAGYHDLSAIHFLSHGSEGQVWLGNTLVSLSNVDQFAAAFASWSQSLQADADLLFYGCRLAGNDVGLQLVDSLGHLTHADVAASVDDTGHSLLGGNWTLEYATGSIETQVAFAHEAQASWLGKLAAINVTTTSDVVNGSDGVTSLREAMIQSNAGTGGDTIVLPAGTYTLTMTGSGENVSASGDLDILKDVTIHGAGSGTTIIDASGMVLAKDRVFDIQTGAIVTIEGLTVRGGDSGSSGGGGALIHAGAELIANYSVFSANHGNRGGAIENDGTFLAYHSIFNNNNASNGGAIENAGNMQLTDAVVKENVASNAGGGLHNNGSAVLDSVTLNANQANLGGGIYHTGASSTLSLVNVTISVNQATVAGGGIWTDQNINATNVTISANHVTLVATGNGGGVMANGASGNVTLFNSILYDNTADLGPNANRALISVGYNISDSTAISSPAIGDQIDVDPLLAPLDSNGGFLQTQAILAGSPAIDHGTNVGTPAFDQRGYGRNGGTDVGAFEYEGLPMLTLFASGDTYIDTNSAGNNFGVSSSLVIDETGGAIGDLRNAEVRPQRDSAGGSHYWRCVKAPSNRQRRRDEHQHLRVDRIVERRLWQFHARCRQLE